MYVGDKTRNQLGVGTDGAGDVNLKREKERKATEYPVLSTTGILITISPTQPFIHLIIERLPVDVDVVVVAVAVSSGSGDSEGL